ncbi:MAG: preprotein translocase subunit SecG [Candidatus Eiseniibacteriota bacterium]
MTTFISSIHVISCIALVVSILLQSGKGGGLAGAFGAGSSQTLFGGRGAATFLTRASTTLAVVFFLTSLTLGLTASRGTATAGKSLIQEEARRRAEQQANQPAPGQGAPSATQGMPSQAPGSAPMQGAPITTPSQTPPAPPAQQGTTPQGSGGSK